MYTEYIYIYWKSHYFYHSGYIFYVILLASSELANRLHSVIVECFQVVTPRNSRPIPELRRRGYAYIGRKPLCVWVISSFENINVMLFSSKADRGSGN